MTLWLQQWKSNDWKTSSNKNIKKDLWKILDEFNTELNIEWIHVKAHADNYYNNMVDKLANEAAHNIVSDILNIVVSFNGLSYSLENLSFYNTRFQFIFSKHINIQFVYLY